MYLFKCCKENKWYSYYYYPPWIFFQLLVSGTTAFQLGAPPNQTPHRTTTNCSCSQWCHRTSRRCLLCHCQCHRHRLPAPRQTCGVGRGHVTVAPPSWCRTQVVIIIIIRTFIKRHKSGNIHSEALYMSIYTCVVEL